MLLKAFFYGYKLTNLKKLYIDLFCFFVLTLLLVGLIFNNHCILFCKPNCLSLYFITSMISVYYKIHGNFKL